MKTLKAEIAELDQAEPPADYSVDTIREWLKSIRNASDEKAVHLLIARIEAVRTENKTDFNVESTLKPVLEKMVAGERNIEFIKLHEPELAFLFSESFTVDATMPRIP